MDSEIRPAERALSAMKDARYNEAIDLFEKQLAQDPKDLRSLLQLGFCHLLNRSEQRFLSIYRAAAALKRRLGEISESLGRLFHRYELWVKKLTATALVLSSVAAGACQGVPKYGAPMYEPTDSASDMDAGDGDTNTTTETDQETSAE